MQDSWLSKKKKKKKNKKKTDKIQSFEDTQEYRDTSIILLLKRKGNPQVCDNPGGISLLSIAGMILGRVLPNRLNEHLEQSGLLPES